MQMENPSTPLRVTILILIKKLNIVKLSGVEIYQRDKSKI